MGRCFHICGIYYQLVTIKAPWQQKAVWVIILFITELWLFRVFGCRVFPYLRDYSPHKLAPRSTPCIFIGYSTNYKGYRCLDPTFNRIYTTWHTQFDEATFPYASSSSSKSLKALQITSFDEVLPISYISDSPLTSQQIVSYASSHADHCCPCVDDSVDPQPAPTSPATDQQPSTELVVQSSIPNSPPLALSIGCPTNPPYDNSLSSRYFQTEAPSKPSISSTLGINTFLFRSSTPKGFKSASKHPQ